MLGLPLDSPGAFLAVALVAVAVTALLARGLQRIGFTLFEACLLAASPLVSTLDADLFVLDGAIVAVNLAGFFIPFLVAGKVVLERRAPLLATVGCTAVVSAVAYVASYPVPGRGVLLHYQAPALAAVVVTFIAVRARFDQAGPVAFTSGSMGVVIGADAFHLRELLAAGPVQRVVIGGAGVLDGIFLVGLLAMLLVLLGASVWTAFERQKRPDAPADLPPAAAASPLRADAVAFVPLAARPATDGERLR